MPAFQACSAAWHKGSRVELSKIPRPKERLMIRMLYWLFSVMACSMAAITVLSVAEPFWSRARRLMMLAFGAIPRKVVLQFPQLELPPLPAMMPATCVPWPYRSLVVLAEGSKFWLYTTRLTLLEPVCVRSQTG